MSKKAYVAAVVQGLIPVRDLLRLRKRGWVVADDYTQSSVRAVFEIDTDTMDKRVVGLVTSPAHVGQVAKRVKTARAQRNILVRLDDLMDIKLLQWRTGRSKATIIGTWLKWDDWPAPVAKYGRSSIWFWPDVLACLERHGVTVRREVADGNRNEGEEDTKATPGTNDGRAEGREGDEAAR